MNCVVCCKSVVDKVHYTVILNLTTPEDPLVDSNLVYIHQTCTDGLLSLRAYLPTEFIDLHS